MRRMLATSLALGLIAVAPLPAVADTFDAKAQQEIRDIVKAYLMEHPEVIIEAVQGLEARQEAQRAEQAKGQIGTLRAQLLRDPRDQVLGNPDGDVTLVEFFDYRCGYCKQAQPILMELIKADPKLRVVLKEFPILGPDSVLATRAAIASVPQGKYAAFHEALINTRGALGEDKIMEVAKAVGLDTTRLKADMAKAEIATQIDDAHTLAEKLAINGTPTFIIGENLVPGAVDLDTLQKLVAEARKTCAGSC